MKSRTNETLVSRPTILNVGGKWEVAALCRDSDGLLCKRLLGVYSTLDQIPDEYMN